MGKTENGNKNTQMEGFRKFASKQVVFWIIITVVLLWGFSVLLSSFSRHAPETASSHQVPAAGMETDHDLIPAPDTEEPEMPHVSAPAHTAAPAASQAAPEPTHAAPTGHSLPASHTPAVPRYHNTAEGSRPIGYAFVEATIAPIHHELKVRWYGWRSNDIFQPTDNVNNIQLGVLEVTRRTVEKLAERIARTGSTQAFDKNLENARSHFNYSAFKLWLPSSESEYEKGIKELNAYKKRLTTGEAFFFTRTDNLIPLLRAYENLLGSCDENLVKMHEENGSEVSWFDSDDYFYYAQGVALAMEQILLAVEQDFHETLRTRNGLETLHHAIESLKHATHIHPWLILDSDYSSFFANHRANMAGHIGHARFYLDVLVRTIST